MKRGDARAMVDAIVAMRAAAGDETAVGAAAIYPRWRVQTGYAAGDRVRHGGVLYRCLTGHLSQEDWQPGAAPSLWAKVLIPGAEIPEWEQPDSTNPYSAGDRVRHNGKTWESAVDGNVWEPGVYGWTEV